MAEDDPTFFRARCPLTGARAKIVAHFVLLAEQQYGGEIVPVAGRPLEEQLALTADNMRRMIAMVAAHRPGLAYVERAQVAVDASVDFCVAVALSADEIQARARRRRG